MKQRPVASAGLQYGRPASEASTPYTDLLPSDLTFNPAIPNQFCHYTDKELFEFVRSIKSVGGAITINVPIDVENGHIPEDSHSQLVRLSKSLNAK